MKIHRHLLQTPNVADIHIVTTGDYTVLRTSDSIPHRQNGQRTEHFLRSTEFAPVITYFIDDFESDKFDFCFVYRRLSIVRGGVKCVNRYSKKERSDTLLNIFINLKMNVGATEFHHFIQFWNKTSMMSQILSTSCNDVSKDE